MLVSDLTHFLDLSEDAPAPACRLAQHFGNIVRAATAGERVGERWTSALPCRRRPGNRPCPGRIIIVRYDPPAPIGWRCSVCADKGVISNWNDSPYDLRRRRLALVGAVSKVAIADEVATELREVLLLDPDCERVVFSMHVHHDGGAVLHASEDDLEELIGFVAAEANRESNRRRPQAQRRVTRWALPELDVARVRRWCAARVPEDARHQVRVECDIAPRHLTLVERRAPWR